MIIKYKIKFKKNSWNKNVCQKCSLHPVSEVKTGGGGYIYLCWATGLSPLLSRILLKAFYIKCKMVWQKLMWLNHWSNLPRLTKDRRSIGGRKCCEI